MAGKDIERPNESPAHEARETTRQEQYEQRTGKEAMPISKKVKRPVTRKMGRY